MRKRKRRISNSPGGALLAYARQVDQEKRKRMDYCPDCGSDRISVKEVVHEFDYGAAPFTVKLTAVIPVHECRACHFAWTDWQSEELHQKAVEEHLIHHKDGNPNNNTLENLEIVRRKM